MMRGGLATGLSATWGSGVALDKMDLGGEEGVKAGFYLYPSALQGL